VSSEFRYRDVRLKKNSLVLAVSQSGETADTLAAVKRFKKLGASVLAICNVKGSSLTRVADATLYTLCGPEVGVASTKAYTSQVFCVLMLALYIASLKGEMAPAAIAEIAKEAERIPALAKEVIDKSKKTVEEIAAHYSKLGCFLFLGRGLNYPTAMEGALKLKELSYIPAEGYAAGEMKHGPIALIDEYRAVVCVAPHDALYEKMFSNIQEIKARKGRVLALVTEGDTKVKALADECIELPKVREELSPLLNVIPLQFLAYDIARNLGYDIDKPRNLAKSVTVE
jgi:glucosamine--fructose-6-phosphate aminotransferase (isomerizing)